MDVQIVQMLALGIKLDQVLDWVVGEVHRQPPRYVVFLRPTFVVLIFVWRMRRFGAGV